MGNAATLTYQPFGMGFEQEEQTNARRRSESLSSFRLGVPIVDSTTALYGRVVPDRIFFEHFLKLAQLQTRRDLWPDDAEPPSYTAILYAQTVLAELSLDRLVPSSVVASAEGGVAVCFVKGNNYSDIECLNNGSILGVTSNRRERPTVWEIDADPAAIAGACSRIRKFLNT